MLHSVNNPIECHRSMNWKVKVIIYNKVYVKNSLLDFGSA